MNKILSSRAVQLLVLVIVLGFRQCKRYHSPTTQPANFQWPTDRAAWLKAKLAERKWSKQDYQKILDDINVQDDIPRKVIAGLKSKPIRYPRRRNRYGLWRRAPG